MYFIYKPKMISGMGGVFPHVYDDSIEFGIESKRGYYLGRVDDVTKLMKYKDYIVAYIDDETAEGFKLLDVDRVPDYKKGLNNSGMYPIRKLNKKEKELKKKAEKFMLKLELREKLQNEAGDTDDLLADLSKRVELLERLLMTFLYYHFNNEKIPSEKIDEYLNIISDYVKSVEKGELKSRIDIDGIRSIYEKIKERQIKLTEIIQKEYLDKLGK